MLKFPPALVSASPTIPRVLCSPETHGLLPSQNWVQKELSYDQEKGQCMVLQQKDAMGPRHRSQMLCRG